MNGLEHRGEPPAGIDIAAGGDADASCEGSGQVRQDVAEEVGPQHDVESLWIQDE